MNVALWILAGITAVAILASGFSKLAWSRERLRAKGYTWVDDFGDGTIRAIGVLELAAAVGLILPAVLDIAPVLVPIAAVGLAVLMAGAVAVHLRRHEPQVLALPVAILVVAAVLAVGRFALAPFGS